MQAISKLTGGMIASSSTYRLDHKVSEGPIRSDEFKANLAPRYEKLKGRGETPDICYRSAVHAARAGNAITKKTEKTFNEGKNYPPGYLRMMGINDQSKQMYFNSANITEAGFLNFCDESGEFKHTAYVHRDPDGKLLLAHTNSLALDRELGPTVSMGGVNVHDITLGKDSDINRHLLKERLNFHYSPASEVNARA